MRIGTLQFRRVCNFLINTILLCGNQCAARKTPEVTISPGGEDVLDGGTIFGSLPRIY